MILVLSDEKGEFVNDVYPSYRAKTPMFMLEKESLINTIDSFIEPAEPKPEPLSEVKPMKPTRVSLPDLSSPQRKKTRRKF